MTKKNTIGSLAGCQICGSTRLTTILELGHQPVLQKYLTKAELHESETSYPLNLVFCKACGLAQLDYIVDPKAVFMPEYPYRTGLTGMLVRNFNALAATLSEQGHYTADDLIVDIGSNDGTLLRQFKDRGARIVGVEPTNVAKIATKSGIPTLQQYFGKQSVRDIKKRYGTPRVITAANVFAHIHDTEALVSNIKALMDANTVFVSESQYWRDTIEKTEFDCIYNEHLRYYALKPMIKMFGMHGLSVIDAERIQAAGGSIRVYAKKGMHAMSTRAKDLLRQEVAMGLYDLKVLRAFAAKAHTARHDLVALLMRCKQEGARIVGLTSAGRSNSLLGFTRIDASIIDYAGEKKGSPKIGMYTPGSHIPVVDEKQIIKDQPEYVLVLSWHIGEELMKKTRAAGYKGTFIVPLPSPHIVKNS